MITQFDCWNLFIATSKVMLVMLTALLTSAKGMSDFVFHAWQAWTLFENGGLQLPVESIWTKIYIHIYELLRTFISWISLYVCTQKFHDFGITIITFRTKFYKRKTKYNSIYVYTQLIQVNMHLHTFTYVYIHLHTFTYLSA